MTEIVRIDDCIHTFEELALVVLPEHYQKLASSLKNPWPASIFSRSGFGPKAIAGQLGFSNDFGGCYVLAEPGKAIYVGISRNVLMRVRQHMLGKTHFDASLAYAMAQRNCPTNEQRSVAMESERFKAAFSEAQAYLRTLHVAAVEITNPLELYVFEAFAAMTLGTSEWNTFRTH